MDLLSSGCLQREGAQCMQRSTLNPPRNHLWQRSPVHSLFWVVWVTPGVGVASVLGSVLLSGHPCRCSGIVLVFLHQAGAKKAQGIQLSLPGFPKNPSLLHSAAKHLLSPGRYVAPGSEIPSCVPHAQTRKPGGWGTGRRGASGEGATPHPTHKCPRNWVLWFPKPERIGLLSRPVSVSPSAPGRPAPT